MSKANQPPRFNARSFLRRLARRRGQKRSSLVTAEVNLFVARWREYHLNRSVPVGDFDPKRQYGGVTTYHSQDPRVRRANLLRVLAEAIVSLPPGTPISIRSAIPTDYGRIKGIAWVRGPHDPQTGAQMTLPWRGQFDAATGVFLHGDVVTPTADQELE